MRTDGRDVVGDERSHLRLKLDAVRLVPAQAQAGAQRQGSGADSGSEARLRVRVGVRVSEG